MSDEPEQSPVESLTPRERDVLAQLAEGKTNREIAEALVLAVTTVKWYARQIYGKLGVSNRQEAAQRALALGLVPTRQSPRPQHNLPAQLTPFVGRKEELAQLQQLLADPGVRLLTIVGPGGMGKTRLALHTATTLLVRAPEMVSDGVYFLPSGEVEEVAGLGDALAQTLDLASPAGEGNPDSRLRRYLQEKKMLLLLDSVEHLAGQALTGWLEQLLRAAPDLTVMATSRQRLAVPGEQLFWLQGLPVPAAEEPAPPDQAQAVPAGNALALFLQTAQRVQPGFALTAANRQALIRICRQVGGMPLGIELAAAWMRLLTPEELLAELGRPPDLLEMAAGNVPPHQRSLRAIFDTSWRLLTPPEQQAIRALSIFRAGFSREAAAEIAAVSLPQLLALANKCWLQREEDGRFSTHDLLHQYAAEALAAEPEQEARLRERHSAYYCAWLAGQEEAIVGPQQVAVLAAVERELANVRRACRTAVELGKLEPLRSALNTLGRYYRWRGHYAAGDRIFSSLLQAVEGGAGPAPQRRLLQARLLVWQISLQNLLGKMEQSQALRRQARDLVDRLEQNGQALPFERMQIAITTGYVCLHRLHDPEQALHHFTLAQSLLRQIGTPGDKAEMHLHLARARRTLGELDEAERLVRQGIALLREHGSAPALADALTLRGNILTWMGRLAEAESLLQEQVRLPGAHPDVEGYRLYNLGRVRCWQGNFEQAEAAAAEAERRYRENQLTTGLMWAKTLRADIRLHQGRYDDALTIAAERRAQAPSSAQQAAQAFASYVAGACALARAEWSAAADHLQRSLAADPPTANSHFTLAHACLALVARQRGEEDGWEWLASELELALASRRLPGLLFSLLVAALLLADRDEIERAGELYALVQAEPLAQNSRWWRAIAADELATVAHHSLATARVPAGQQARLLELRRRAADLLAAREPGRPE